MRRTALYFLVLAAGCARTAPVEPADAQATLGRPVIAPLATDNDALFDSTVDLDGSMFERAVAPDTPALPPIERFAVAPRPRTVPVSVLDPDPNPLPKLVRPPFPPSANLSVRVDPPAERVPHDLGAGAGAVPAKPKLPVAAAPTKRSRDVNLPPLLPTLGRQASARVGYDDPTAELGNAVIMGPSVKPPIAPAPFLKVAIPDPFELGEQVRPSIPSALEPGLTPAIVSPRRPK